MLGPVAPHVNISHKGKGSVGEEQDRDRVSSREGNLRLVSPYLCQVHITPSAQAPHAPTPLETDGQAKVPGPGKVLFQTANAK